GFLRAVLEAGGSRRVGFCAASGWSDGVRDYPAGPVAPDAPALARMLAAMRERDCESSVVALPAEALNRRAAEGLEPVAAVVTNARGVERRDLARLVRGVREGGAAIV